MVIEWNETLWDFGTTKEQKTVWLEHTQTSSFIYNQAYQVYQYFKEYVEERDNKKKEKEQADLKRT